MAATTVGQAQTRHAGAEPIRVVEIPDSCIGADQYFAKLARHRATIRWARDSEAATTFNVRVVAVDAVATGELVVVGPDGSKTGRTVSGRSCDEVAEALALVGALSIDPLSVSELQTNESAADALPRPPASAPLPRTAESRQSRIWIRSANVRPLEARSSTWQNGRGHAMYQGGEAGAYTQIGGTGESWIGVSAKYWLSPGWGGILAAPIKLSLGVSRTLFARKSISTVAGSATLALRATSFDAGICPLGVRKMASVRFWGCGFGEAGWLQAEQRNPVSAKSDAGTFFQIGLVAQLEVRIFGGLGYTAGVGGSTPLTHYRIQVDSVAGSPSVRLNRATALITMGLQLGDW